MPTRPQRIKCDANWLHYWHHGSRKLEQTAHYRIIIGESTSPPPRNYTPTKTKTINKIAVIHSKARDKFAFCSVCLITPSTNRVMPRLISPITRLDYRLMGLACQPASAGEVTKVRGWYLLFGSSHNNNKGVLNLGSSMPSQASPMRMIINQ